MKANELMIGDWVYSPIRGLWQIQFSDFSQMRRFISEDGELAVTPTPLNEEILKANSLTVGRNVVNEDLIMRCDWYNDYIHPLLWKIVIVSSEADIFLHCVLDIRIHYVHELQHALRLCGLNEMADNFKVEEKNETSKF